MRAHIMYVSGAIHHDEKHHGDEEEHGDYYLSYSLNCKNMDKLKTIEVTLFESFNGFENIESLWISPTDSGSDNLTNEKNVIKIK